MKSYAPDRVRHGGPDFTTFLKCVAFQPSLAGCAWTCSTSFPSGDLVDGSPLVAHLARPQSHTNVEKMELWVVISLALSIRFARNSKVVWGLGLSWHMQSLRSIHATGKKLWTLHVFHEM